MEFQGPGMNDCDQKEHLSFALLPVFTIGAKDGINPCGIAAVLIFIIYLSRVGRTQRRLAGFGALFIASAVMTHFVLLFGAGDPLLASPVVYGAIRAAYLFLAAVFLVLGVLHISDWRRYRKCFDGGVLTSRCRFFYGAMSWIGQPAGHGKFCQASAPPFWPFLPALR